MLKKNLCLILAVLFLITSLLPLQAAAEEEIQEISIRLESNLSSRDSLTGLFFRNNVYISAEDAAELSGLTVSRKSGSLRVLDRPNKSRSFQVDGDDMYITELYDHGEGTVALSTLLYRGQSYVSALKFLNYTGTQALITSEPEPRLVAIRTPDVLDMVVEFLSSDSFQIFWWDQLETDGSTMEKKLTNAGIVATINRNSNICDMIFKGKQIQQQAIEEALLAIVLNEGQHDMDKEDLVKYSGELMKEISDLGEKDLGLLDDLGWFPLEDGAGEIKDCFSDAGKFLDLSTRALEITKTCRKYASVQESQRDLLKDTILANPDGSELVRNGWRVLEDASRAVDKRIHAQWDGALDETLDSLTSYLRDQALSEASEHAAGITAVWDGVIAFEKVCPLTRPIIKNKDKLYQAYNCSIVQLAAHQLLLSELRDCVHWDMYHDSPSQRQAHMQRLKQLLILRLKASVTARDYMLDSNYLDDQLARDFRQQNLRDLKILRKTEDCSIPFRDVPLSKDQREELKAIGQWLKQEPEQPSSEPVRQELSQLIQGAWARDGETEPSYIFYKDGTCLWDGYDKHSWSLSNGNSMTLIFAGGIFTSTIISCDSQEMTINAFGEDVHLHRVGDVPPDGSAGHLEERPSYDQDTNGSLESSIIGKWALPGSTEPKFAFYPDGTCIAEGSVETEWYLESGDMLCIPKYKNGPVMRAQIVSCDGKTMEIIAYEDYYREKGTLVRCGDV